MYLKTNLAFFDVLKKLAIVLLNKKINLKRAFTYLLDGITTTEQIGNDWIALSRHSLLLK
jgi:hypothetical protein